MKSKLSQRCESKLSEQCGLTISDFVRVVSFLCEEGEQEHTLLAYYIIAGDWLPFT